MAVRTVRLRIVRTPAVPRALFAAVLLGLSAFSPARAQSDVEIHGFAEFGAATRVREDVLQPNDLVSSEARLQLELSHYGDGAESVFKGDFASDGITGAVDIDVRQATIGLRAADWLDLRVGRQILTWGTGDLVFLNDLFPKDFVSFFIGRDDEYLKAPATALKLTFYSSLVNLDLVATPVFEPDRSITGERLSFFDPSRGGLVSASSTPPPERPVRPAKDLRNGELAWRLFRTVAGYELAAYGYVGFTKQPAALESPDGPPAYARLRVFGASARGALAGGIANAEGAYYDQADRVGDDPLLPNAQWRGLVGYERELFPDMTGAAQYYVEHTLDHDRLLAASPAPAFEPSRTRHVLTTRLTRRMRQQTVIASLFAFVSPNDGDGHLRPALSYDWSDGLRITGGANVMFGKPHTFFGQLERATNVYLRARYSF